MRDDKACHPIAWPAALGIATIAGTLASACMMPFVALAVLSAATMSARRAGLTIGTIWATNQALGFLVLGYPATAYAAAWGAALGVASIAAAFVARAAMRGQRAFAAAPMLAAFGAAFVAYEVLLFGFAMVAGGVDTFAPSIVLRILLNEATWFAGLVALYAVLTRAAPCARSRPRTSATRSVIGRELRRSSFLWPPTHSAMYGVTLNVLVRSRM